jgi:two-component system, cell cycle response regulator DivK
MAGELILIVEDNEKNLKLARDVLQNSGYRTVEARTAEEALAMVADEQPDLILMDIELPGMGGFDGLKHLKGDEATALIPVCALTAFAMNDDREQCLRAGFDGYLSKPITVAEFPHQVQGLLDTARDEAAT